MITLVENVQAFESAEGVKLVLFQSEPDYLGPGYSLQKEVGVLFLTPSALNELKAQIDQMSGYIIDDEPSDTSISAEDSLEK
ncbi:MAG TPA: hypothetical protein VH593_06760 [Ktedonobacteraceae bacterium]|jgi:hypothetical protein